MNMNYEKLYKEALERARDSFTYPDYPGFIRADVVFPELKESVDEKIRKALIQGFNECLDSSSYPKNAQKYWHGIAIEDILAWLEKQGGQETLCDKCKKENAYHSCQDITALGRCAVEHEQNPADKVKPKFHEGDWIVFNDDNYKILDTKDIYTLEMEDGDEICVEIATLDKRAHLWTIEDAKNGDVLYSKKHNLIWIYKDNKHYYASINLNYADVVSFDNEIVIPSNVCPANRVQKSILFQKMHKAGYDWDSEKKELKKSQRMISAEAKEALYGQKNAWSEEDELNLKGIIDEIEANKSEAPEYDIDTYDRYINWLKSLKERRLK